MATPMTPSRFRSTCSIFDSSFCQRTFGLAEGAPWARQVDTSRREDKRLFIWKVPKADDCSRGRKLARVLIAPKIARENCALFKISAVHADGNRDHEYRRQNRFLRETKRLPGAAADSE